MDQRCFVRDLSQQIAELKAVRLPGHQFPKWMVRKITQMDYFSYCLILRIYFSCIDSNKREIGVLELQHIMRIKNFLPHASMIKGRIDL